VGCAQAKVQELLDGKPLDSAITLSTDDQSVVTHWVSDGARHWIRLTVSDANGNVQLLGNPIYLNF
jgi:hypothetical protein